MKTIFSILKLEIKKLYFSPIPWVTAAIFSIHSGYIFAQLLSDTVSQQELFGGAMGITHNIFSSSQGIFPQLIQVLFLYVPLITMGKFSKEYSQGTYKLLFSSPIKLRDIVLGKFLSLLTFFLVLLVSICPIFILSINKIPHLDLGLLLSGILALFLLFLLYSAIGLFVSSTTKYSILSAIITLTLLYLLREIADIGKYSATLRDVTFNLAISNRANNLIGGLICSDDLLYFLLLSFSFLLLAFLQLYYRLNPTNKLRKICVYLVLGGLLLSVLVLLQNPYLIKCYDTTANKQNTLSQQSIEILEQVKEPIQITTYVNMADYLNWVAVPPAINTDKKRFQKYLRTKPDIQMNYVYYEADPIRNADYKSPERLPTSSIVRVFCEANKMDYSKILPVWKSNNDTFQKEQNSIFRILKTKSGTKESVLRIYDDMLTHPGENEISLAIKALSENKPRIGFVSSNTLRTLSTSQEIGYGIVLSEKGNRSAAINQGLDVEELNLNTMKLISPNIDITIFSDLSSEKLSTHSYNLIKNHIKKGRNCVLLLGNTNSTKQDNLLKSIGLNVTPEVILFPQKEIDKEIIPCLTTSELANICPIGQEGLTVMLPQAKSLSYDLGGDFEMYPLLKTIDNDCISIDNKHPDYDIKKRIKHWGNYVTAIALERFISGKKQRIIVVSDSNFLSNKEINTHRKGYDSQNIAFFTAALHWLSDGAAPLNILPKFNRDTFIKLTASELHKITILLIYPFALLYLLSGTILLIRRKRR